MKFSVLLPTRNRLEYLRYAVETVLRQDYGDWECIISDNFSQQDIAGYAQSLVDTRIKYYRTASSISVTDNWNNALDKSTGEYVIMLGDDDGLMQRYFTTMRDLIGEYGHPDLIYTKAFLYAYPGAIPEHPNGYLQKGQALFIPTPKGPFLLDPRQARKMVRQSLNFRISFAYNMQHSLVSRGLIDSLREYGAFYQSPFPDYYATNVMMLKAERILIYPRPMVTIGITPKSYGFFHFNQREAEGVRFLKSLPDPTSDHDLEHVLLPGTNINTSWLLAMEAIKANYGAEFALSVNHRRYRFLQIVHVYKECYLDKRLSRGDLLELEARMHGWEKFVYHAGLSIFLVLARCVPQRQRHRVVNRVVLELTRQFPRWKPKMSRRMYRNIIEVFERVDPLRN